MLNYALPFSDLNVNFCLSFHLIQMRDFCLAIVFSASTQQNIGPSVLWLLPPKRHPCYSGSIAMQWMRCQELFGVTDAVAPSRRTQQTHLRSRRREGSSRPAVQSIRAHSYSGLRNGSNQDGWLESLYFLKKVPNLPGFSFMPGWNHPD